MLAFNFVAAFAPMRSAIFWFQSSVKERLGDNDPDFGSPAPDPIPPFGRDAVFAPIIDALTGDAYITGNLRGAAELADEGRYVLCIVGHGDILLSDVSGHVKNGLTGRAACG